MANLLELYNRMKSIDTVDLFDESIEQSSGVIIETNVQQLEEDGEGKEGDKLREYSSKYYANLKKRIGSKTSPTPDLKYTGDFHKGFYIQKTKKGVHEINSKDEKSERLEKIYPESQIFGIQEKRIGKPAKEVKTQFLKLFRKEIKL